jgi:hypothetical protein
MSPMSFYLLHTRQPSAQRLIRRVSQLKPYVSASSVTERDVVIRWGYTSESDPPSAQVLNSQMAVQRTKSRVAMGRFLRRVGIRFLAKDGTGPEGQRVQRQYQIPLFDLSPLACFRSDSSSVWINQRLQRVQDSFEEVTFDDDRVAIRAGRLAMRALHALGLDHGLVSIGMTAKGLLHVLDVTPAPVLQGRMLDLYALAVEEYMERRNRPLQTQVCLLGADVELMLRNQAGKMVLASKYFSRKGRVGCDDRSIQFDGRRLPLLELRPEPDTSPLGLLANLRDTMLEATRKINRPQVEWRAGSMPFPRYCTGGHIHFSGVPFSSRLVKALDNYVGLPLMMVEDEQTAKQRRPRYGFLGDVRYKDYGGFEYRTPGSFVVDPDVTAAALCLAYVVAVHHRDLPIADLYDEPTQLAFYNGDRANLLPIVERNFRALRGMPAYVRYKDYIDPLFHMIQSGQTWDETTDVRVVWDIPLRAERRAPHRRIVHPSARIRA